MKVESFLTELPRGLQSRPGMLRPERPRRGRPRFRVRLSIDSPDDAAAARQYGIPVYLLTSELVTGLGYPVEFPDQLLVGRGVDPAIDSSYPRLVLDTETALVGPGIEDVISVLLRIDPLAARGVAARNRSSVAADQLLRSVVQLHVEEEATWVNLQEFSSSIPRRGSALPAAWLRELDQRPSVEGLRA